jgi:hypothetical protein
VLRGLDFLETLFKTGSFLAMRVAISWFTLDTPESFSGAVSVEMTRGGVACRRTFRDRIDARKLKMNNHMDGDKEVGYLSLFLP